MEDFSTQSMVQTCSNCAGDTEFYCKTCKSNLCPQCKEGHVIDLDTVYHDVIYSEKFEFIHKAETCGRHPDMIYDIYCQSCKLSVCNLCTEHKNHDKLDLKTAYRITRQEHKETIHRIRSEILSKNHILLSGIRKQRKIWNAKISDIQSVMFLKATRLKDLVNVVLFNAKTKCNLILIHRLQHQKRKLNRLLANVEHYEHKSDQLSNKPVTFLLFYKETFINEIKETVKLKQMPLLSMNEELNKDGVLLLLKEIQCNTVRTQVGNEQLLRMMTKADLQKSVKVTDISYGRHISLVTPNKFWVSDWTNLILTDTSGETLQCVTDKDESGGVHTVSNAGELIYIDSKTNIVKILTDSRTKVKLIKIIDSWRPRSLYFSSFSGDLLVGMSRYYTDIIGKVTRYDSTGQEIQTVQFNNKGQPLFGDPKYLTQNCNGDIIVSDYILRAVVVTDSGGNHRFSYTGPPLGSGLVRPGSGLQPAGICTDGLSHILVCDTFNDTIHIIDKDGHFLSLLLTKQESINKLYGLCYDYKTHLLYVGRGSSDCTDIVSVYRYIQRQYILTDDDN
ncbi:uncharacterized protein LOC133176077 [Saccostrea echinata]|uniref:uncharacterized protein LOC133176077 n=1 Tax=Saccostrea echinata TaxID=191078 RepID=UPI002A7F5C3C|nr:uncharacterized protein LOC133176077 [Saccostrea echinata]